MSGKYQRLEQDADDDSVALMMGQAPPRLRMFGGSSNNYVELENLDPDGRPTAEERQRHVDAMLKEAVRKSSKNLLYVIGGIAFSIVAVMVTYSLHHHPHSYPAYLLQSVLTKPLDPGTRLFNGTHYFRRSTIMISLDGMHPHYISKDRTPYLHNLSQSGFAPPYMLPSFPSQTFPNHYTLVTGMYPVNHGIVGNTFYDPELELDFKNTDPAKSRDRRFWGGEPIWTTARRNQMISAVHMWPGSEAEWSPDEVADEVSAFNRSESLDDKADHVFKWLDKGTYMPQIMLVYVPNIDTVGHKKGIYGPELEKELLQVDKFVQNIAEGIQSRNLTHVLNMVVVSDHGMAPTSNERLIFLDDVIANYSEIVSSNRGWPLAGLRFWSPGDEDFALASARSSQRRLRPNPGFRVFKSDEFPPTWHFSSGRLRYNDLTKRNAKRNDDDDGDVEEDDDHDSKEDENEEEDEDKTLDDGQEKTKPKPVNRPLYGRYKQRLAPMYLVPEIGYNLLTHKQFDDMNNDYFLKGVHGYIPSEPLMRALFLAQGPAFPPGRYYPFDNVDVYSAICRSVGMEPSAVSDGDFRGRRMLKRLPVEENYPGVNYHIDHFENSSFGDYFMDGVNKQ